MGHEGTVPILLFVAILPVANKVEGMVLNRVISAIYDDHPA
jgi:hypothetical protein